MPDLQVLPSNPSFGAQLGRSLGEGLGAGFNQGISANLQKMLSTKKELGKVRTSLNSLSRYFPKGSLDSDTSISLEQKAKQLVSEGHSADDATLLAYLEYEKGQQGQEPEIQTKPIPEKVNESLKATEPNNSERRVRKQQITLNSLNEPDPENFWERTFKHFGQALAMDAQSKENLIDPINGFVEGRSFGLIKTPDSPNSAGNDLKKAGKIGGSFGAVNSLGKRFQGALNPTTIAGKIGTEAAAGGAYSAIIQLAEKEKVDPKQLALDASIWGGIGGLFAIAPKIMSLFRKPVETLAKETGRNAEVILKEAAENSGADMAKALEGEATQVNKIRKELSKETEAISKKVEEAPKDFFNKKQALRERELFGAKLPESPFEEYFAVGERDALRNAAKKPETLAKEAENASKIIPVMEKKYLELSSKKHELKELESSLKSLDGEAKQRLDVNIQYKRKSIEKTLDELKDLQYELKYSRKRPTEAEMELAAKKSAEDLVAEVKNPTVEGQKRLKETIGKDQRYLERAAKLVERGELPGELRPDTFIRVQKKYLDGYEAMISELQQANRSLNGARDVQSLKQISDNRKAIEHLTARQKRLKANIINQTDKIKALNAIEGPSGAFYRQQLKNARKDIEQFQQDFFKTPHLKTPQQIKTKKVTSPKFKEIEESAKMGENLAKNPTKENINKVAEKFGENPETIKKESSNLGDFMREERKKIEQSKATEADVVKTTKEVNTTLNKWLARLKKAPKTAATGFALGLVSGIIEEETGLKLGSHFWGYFVPGGYVGKGAGTIFSAYARKSIQNFYNKKEAEEFRKIKSISEKSKYIQELKKRYNSKRVNDIVKLSQEKNL